MRRTIRVFPRRTKATPDDPLAYVGEPDFFAEADDVDISVAFTWDLPRAEQLAEAWKHVAPVHIGGPAFGYKSGEFEPGKYLKHGYTITSRGCPNRCWFCSVWKREPGLLELPIRAGWNILDDNLLACSEDHVRRVFWMLTCQGRPVEFTGGLEAARLKPWMVDLLTSLKVKQMFFAYDTSNDLEPLRSAGKMLLDAGFSKASHKLRAYVLCGYVGDRFESASRRMRETWDAGFLPMAMLYRGEKGQVDESWKRWQRQWARPTITASILSR